MGEWESGRGRYVVEPNEQGGTEKTHKDAADGEMRFDRTGMTFRERLGRVDSQRCDPKASGTKGHRVEEKMCGMMMVVRCESERAKSEDDSQRVPARAGDGEREGRKVQRRAR